MHIGLRDSYRPNGCRDLDDIACSRQVRIIWEKGTVTNRSDDHTDRTRIEDNTGKILTKLEI